MLEDDNFNRFTSNTHKNIIITGQSPIARRLSALTRSKNKKFIGGD